MTKVIISATNKGGDGKTTLSIIFSEYLSIIRNQKVLLIDFDPQANASSRHLELEYDPTSDGGKKPPIHPDYDPVNDKGWDGRTSIADIFYGKEMIPYSTNISNLDVAPAYSAQLQAAEETKREEVIEKIQNRLKEFVNLKEIQESYDYIIIDTPPAKGPLTRAAFSAATHVIIPAQMEKFSMDGIYGMMQLWKQETYSRGTSNPITLLGIIPNRFRNLVLHKAHFNELKSQKGISEFVTDHKLHERAIYSEILSNKQLPQNIFELPSSNIAREETEKLCDFLYGRMVNNG